MIILDFDKPIIMGVINLTPDSFYHHSRSENIDGLFTKIDSMISEGVDIIDIGAESTRPGANLITKDEEIKRLQEIIPKFKKKYDCILSLDTMKSEVARFGLDHGVDIINDVSGLTFDKSMIDVISSFKAGVILMHMKGTPKTMQEDVSYTSVVDEVFLFLKQQISLCEQKKIKSIFIDPGIGFGKDLESNLDLIRHLELFLELKKPIVIGVSRKSFIDKISLSDVTNRLGGSIGANLVAWRNGANIFRVHDVFETKQAFDVVSALEGV